MMTAFTLSLLCGWWWWWWWCPEYLPTEWIPIGIRSVGNLGVCHYCHHNHQHLHNIITIMFTINFSDCSNQNNCDHKVASNPAKSSRQHDQPSRPALALEQVTIYTPLKMLIIIIKIMILEVVKNQVTFNRCPSIHIWVNIIKIWNIIKYY